MTDVTQLPGTVDLDLDALERPAEEASIQPFTVKIAGRTITMTDPQEIDWQDLVDLESPVEFMRHCVNDDDRAHIRKQSIPGWKIGQLMEAYMEHYRLEDRIAQAQRRRRL